MTQPERVAQNELIPEWDLADRLRKALRVSGVSSHEMTDYLGLSRYSVSRFITGAGQPSTQTLRLWALRTGVPFEWLLTGECNTKVCKSGIPATVHVLPVRRPR